MGRSTPMWWRWWCEQCWFFWEISGCVFAARSSSISINDQCSCLPALPGKRCPISDALSRCSRCWDRENKERFVPTAGFTPTDTTNPPPTRNHADHQTTWWLTRLSCFSINRLKHHEMDRFRWAKADVVVFLKSYCFFMYGLMPQSQHILYYIYCIILTHNTQIQFLT